jgi:hypothetical protein
LRYQRNQLAVFASYPRLPNRKPPADLDGHRFSADGLPLGRCSQKIGLALDCGGAPGRFGQVEKSAYRTQGIGKCHNRAAVHDLPAGAQIGPDDQGAYDAVLLRILNLDAHELRKGHGVGEIGYHPAIPKSWTRTRSPTGRSDW